MATSPFGRGRPQVWAEGRHRLAAIPRLPGAYRFVITESREVHYIGISSNLYMRIAHHRSTQQKYDPATHEIHYQVASDGADWDQMRVWESVNIGKRNSRGNTTKGGNGRRPGRRPLSCEDMDIGDLS